MREAGSADRTSFGGDIVSLFDYETSLEIHAHEPPFASLIMAAYRKADTENSEMLEACWPETISELKARYNAPGGRLAGD